ncbi:SMAD/FHA domain-containing protein, partial [Aureobasidium melanogenum]
QDELENTIVDLSEAKAQLAEKDRLLRNRDQLLESSGLESKRLSEMLEKERSLRRKDLHQFEQSQRGNSTNARMMAQHESRALDLETARSQDRRKMLQLEQQYRDQLVERNQLLFNLWTKLSNLCGNAWASHHSSVNGEPTSIDSISRNLQPFTHNILSAIKTIETLMSNCKAQIRSVEKNLRKDYQVLEQNLDVRVKKMEFLERAVKDAQSAIEVQAQESAQLRSQQNMNRSSKTSIEETAKLKQEIKILKAEIRFHKSAAEKTTGKDAADRKDTSNQLTPRASMANSLLRHHSSSAIEVLQGQNQPPATAKNPSIVIATPPIQPSEQRWIHRLKELERRLKAEREGRLLDRKGARQRLEERDSQLEDLRGMLERERDRRGSIGSSQWEEGADEGRSSRLSRSPPPRRARGPLPSQQDQFRQGDGAAPAEPVVEKQKPNFNATGLLAKEANTVAGTNTVLKYHEPPEARKPPSKEQWRMFVFKGKDMIDTIHLYSRSCWLMGRDQAIVDFHLEHPSISKQHAVVQFRHITKTNEYGDKLSKVKPYLIDLDSANGTRLNGEKIGGSRYIELRDGDVVGFGDSEREYVMMLPK